MNIGMVSLFDSGIKYANFGQNKAATGLDRPLPPSVPKKPEGDTFERSNNAENISFTGTVENEYKNKFEKYRKKFTPEADRLWRHAARIAEKYHSSEITEDHLFLAGLVELKSYITELNDGGDPNANHTFLMPSGIESYVGVTDAIRDKTKRVKVLPVINKHIKQTSNRLGKQAEGKNPLLLKRRPKASNTVMQNVTTMYDYLKTADEAADSGIYSDDILFQSLSLSRNKAFASRMREFRNDLSRELMVKKGDDKREIHLKFYDDKANKLWKNLDLGNDMFILYDGENKVAAKHLLSSFTNIISRPETAYKNLNKDNTEVVIMNNDADFDFINTEVQRARKDKAKTHIFVIPFIEAAKNNDGILEDDDLKTIRNKPAADEDDNVRIVFIASKDAYFANMKNPQVKRSIAHYGQLTIPILNADDTRQMMSDNTAKAFIHDITSKNFDDEAIMKSVEISNSRDGYYPEKAIKFMRDVASYNVDSEKITVEDVERYVTETSDINRTGDVESEFKISFNTGKKLNDIVGSPMTKAEAKSIVDQILNRTTGTKGVTVFLDNGTSYGGGRHHTAEAIAGEAQIPMITINARDFALKDIDALVQNADLSEIKIKKLVSLAKSQAEANKNKTAMIFIENFDNFGSDPIYGLSSIYEQKAFSQLLREMENVRRNDNVNLLIVGSTNRPELLDEDIMKPYKFLDKIVIYSPQDSGDRTDILKYYINKNGMKIKGDTKEEKDAVIRNIAETTAYFTVVDLMYLLDKANSVSKEQGKDAIDKADFVEAFLQTTSGRVSTRHQAEHDKEIVAAHECGHALTLQIMYDLASKSEKPWHLPDQLNFVTLDPRGNYGGAMYPKNSENDEYSFEKMFADIICSYGGHSSEKEFYNMDGSWGITGDMQSATQTARLAVEAMGLGPKTGRMAIQRNGLGLPDVSEKVKNNIFDDIEVILKNANYVSDEIVHTYSDFVQEFAQKYKSKVGTGDCIIPAEMFREELEEWKAKQPDEKQAEFKKLDDKILNTIILTKQGKLAK